MVSEKRQWMERGDRKAASARLVPLGEATTNAGRSALLHSRCRQDLRASCWRWARMLCAVQSHVRTPAETIQEALNRVQVFVRAVPLMVGCRVNRHTAGATGLLAR